MAYRPGYTSRPHPTLTVSAIIGILLILGFLICWMSPGTFEALALFTGDVSQQPWTVLTYQLANASILSIIFGVWWLFGIGNSIEAELGKQRFLAFWTIMSVLAGVMVWVGSLLTGVPGMLWSAWVPLSALTVAWGTRNPNAQVTFMFILPLTGKWLAWLSAILVFFGTTPQLAPFAALPLLLSYLFAANRLAFAPWSGPSRIDAWEKRRDKRLLDLVDDSIERKKEREERERLRRLFEGSISDDDERKEG
ncbi:MAG: hypothetical protein HONBIEJF_02073 [Fimbriimonadaceae bacterium]|nr:hypothetical protein [Fimbriimonadaceae bacterium]